MKYTEKKGEKTYVKIGVCVHCSFVHFCCCFVDRSVYSLLEGFIEITSGFQWLKSK